MTCCTRRRTSPRRVEELAVDGLADLGQFRVGQQAFVGDRAQQVDAQPRQPPPAELLDVIALWRAAPC